MELRNMGSKPEIAWKKGTNYQIIFGTYNAMAIVTASDLKMETAAVSENLEIFGLKILIFRFKKTLFKMVFLSFFALKICLDCA
jgi:hypothetical protein